MLRLFPRTVGKPLKNSPSRRLMLRPVAANRTAFRRKQERFAKLQSAFEPVAVAVSHRIAKQRHGKSDLSTPAH